MVYGGISFHPHARPGAGGVPTSSREHVALELQPSTSIVHRSSGTLRLAQFAFVEPQPEPNSPLVCEQRRLPSTEPQPEPQPNASLVCEKRRGDVALELQI